MPSSQPSLAFAAALAFGVGASAQVLVKDFNTTPSAEPGNSSPSSFQPLPGNRALFVQSTPSTGPELWVTDGTVGGTAMVTELQPGALGGGPQQFVELSSGVYVFTASTAAHGWEVWRTDGTAAGTFLLADIWPGPMSGTAVQLTRIGNEVAFFSNDGVHGIELWKTDGTTLGTQMVVDLSPGISGMSNGGATLAALGSNACVFTALVNQQWFLYRSDLTANGTVLVKAFSVSSIFGPGYLHPFGNQVLFEAREQGTQDEIWVTDGTFPGTFSLGASGIPFFEVVGSTAYFSGYESATGQELWKTDGTVAGTGLVADLAPGGGLFGNGTPWLVGALGGEFLFFSHHPNGRGLFRTDGTAAGTSLITNIGMNGAYYGGGWGTNVLGELWFRGSTAAGTQGLYRTDGTAAGTTLVTDLETGAFLEVGGKVLLAGDDGSSIGSELYETDGTPAGTQLFLDASPPPVSESGFPTIVANFRDEAIVRADDGVHGAELWLTDGTPSGTRLLVDMNPGAAGTWYDGIAASDERILLFPDLAGADGDPWFSDGTPAGTAQLDVFPANSGFEGSAPFRCGDRFVFVGRLPASGAEPWVTDGTVAGTFQLADLVPGTVGSSPASWHRFGERVVFHAYTPTGMSAFVTDGTVAGTIELGQLASNLYLHFRPVEYAGRIWFKAQTPTQGVELWSSDGTPAGTSFALDLDPGPPSSSPDAMVSTANGLLLQARIGGEQRIVATDGTAAGTTVLNVTAGGGFYGPFAFRDGRAVFFGRPAFGPGEKMYVSDGTAAGTTLVGDVDVRAYPEVGALGEERLVLSVCEPLTGCELYALDSSGALLLVADVSPEQGNPRDFYRVGERIVFTADDGVHGNELFAVPFAATGDWAVAAYGSGCPGTAGITPKLELGGVARISSPGFSLELSDGVANSFAVLAWSQRRGVNPLPGCTLWLDAQFELFATTTDQGGAASVPILPLPALLGARFDAQCFVVDPNGPVFGFASSTAGLEFVVGA